MSGAALVAAISAFAAELPLETTERLAALIEESTERATAEHRSTGLVPNPRFEERRRAIFRAWEEADHPPSAVALALRVAATRTRDARAEVRIEPVWTGPSGPDLPFRRTEQALLELIRRAQERLLLVSYAVYRHPVLRGALVEATDRRVRLDIVVESPDESEGRMSADVLAGLGREVVARATVLVWPTEKRPRDDAGHAGVLHAKCAVADEAMLLVSSANLTERAMTSNIELGLMLSGGPLPGQVRSAFEDLRARGTLVPVR